MKELTLLLRVLFGAILRAVLPAAFEAAREASRDTAEDSRPQPELRTRLQNRVRARWSRTGAVGVFVLCAVMLAGCGVKTVYVPDGEAVRLRQPVKRAKIWVMDADGVPRPSRMTIPEGWYALPVPNADKPPEGAVKPPQSGQPAETYPIFETQNIASRSY